ncbi:hypothetical protein D3C72_2426850 [compost metagenome]
MIRLAPRGNCDKVAVFRIPFVASVAGNKQTNKSVLPRNSPNCSWPAYDGKPSSLLAPRDQPLT